MTMPISLPRSSISPASRQHDLPVIGRVPMLRGCSSSLRQKPPRSVPPSSSAASWRQRSSCANCSLALPTSRRHVSAPEPSPAGSRYPWRRVRSGGGSRVGADALIPAPPSVPTQWTSRHRNAAPGRGGKSSITAVTALEDCAKPQRDRLMCTGHWRNGLQYVKSGFATTAAPARASRRNTQRVKICLSSFQLAGYRAHVLTHEHVSM